MTCGWAYIIPCWFIYGFTAGFGGAGIPPIAGAPAGWFGFMPQTADYSTLGVGVFYCILALLLLFTLIARLFLSIARAAGKRSKTE